MNLTQWREGAIIAPLFLIFYPVITDFHPVIPAKAGIQMAAAKLAIRNQA